MLQSKKDRAKGEAAHSSVGSIQKQFFRSQLVLIITLALILGLAGSLINLHFETEKRDQNLRNVAETIAQSPLLLNIQEEEISTDEALGEYLDSLKTTLGDIDVISIVNKNKVRVYHSNPSLIGVPYEGTLPTFTYGEDSDYHTAPPVQFFFTKSRIPEIRNTIPAIVIAHSKVSERKITRRTPMMM